jgi:hypothetical protein
MIDSETHIAFRKRLAEFEAWLGDRRSVHVSEIEAAGLSDVTNDMRGAVELYELNRDRPEKFTAYVSSDGKSITTWMGDILGNITYTRQDSRRRSWHNDKMRTVYATIWGRRYYGRNSGNGMVINLRRMKGY